MNSHGYLVPASKATRPSRSGGRGGASQDEIANCCTLDHAIIGVLWPRLHPNPSSASTARMKVGADLTPELNTYLRGCGETYEYSPEEVVSESQS